MTTPLVTVRGEAELSCAPDLATITATIHATGADADRVRRELVDASTRVRAIVDTHRAALERHGTSGLHVGPVFTGRGARRISGYRGSLTTELVVSDFAVLPQILAAVTALDGAQVNGPWWSLRPTNPIHRQVRIAAIAEARQRAADYAAAFDATLGSLVEVSDLEGSFQPQPRMMKAAFAADAVGGSGEPELDLEPAEQRVSAQVTVRFQLA
ncbi:MAG TPA: SIMPL domain-containing protein [Microlunatus sp.]|jgi:uncharacterized protein YggE|nr:SIMPL domain-containing protein [Microlunatus sp.]